MVDEKMLREEKMLTPIKKVIIILLITLVAGYISLPKESNFLGRRFIRRDLDLKVGNFSFRKNFDLVLGLDLAGGSHLVFEVDTSNIEEGRKKTAVEAVKNVMERRVNLFGISEPNVQTSSFEGKERVIVELPGVKNTGEAIEIIGKIAQLTFAETGTEEEPGLIPTNLTGADLESADVVFDQTTGKPTVLIKFDPEGAKKFEEITQKNVGKPLPILLDSDVVSAPVVQEKIAGGSAQISGEFTLQEARNLSIQLNAGALPAAVNLVEQRTVGATLGTESVEKSVRAGLVGLAMVMIFMILNYGKLGLVSNFALFSFGVITLAIYKLVPVVLTLPGIAGFLLSVGMAVDSNILIFERFKEERLKRNLVDALEVSFGRAWDSIRDANIATLVTAFVLANPLDFNFLNTSGPVRGFAITLSLGVLISLFTGIVVSRNLLRVFVRQK
jgi:preprotein translocase subunit SecD